MHNIQKSVYIVVPSFNASKTIGGVLTDLKKHWANIIVVDDGSADETADIARQHGVIVLRHIINLGQGAALQTGTTYALEQGARFIVHFDADGQHREDQIQKLLEPIIDNKADIVFGSRFLDTRALYMPWTKKWLILKPAIFLNWMLTGLLLSDAHNGYRAMNRKAAQAISITQNRMAHPTEIMSAVKKRHIRYLEVSALTQYTAYGQGFRQGVKILQDLTRHIIFK